MLFLCLYHNTQTHRHCRHYYSDIFSPIMKYCKHLEHLFDLSSCRGWAEQWDRSCPSQDLRPPSIPSSEAAACRDALLTAWCETLWLMTILMMLWSTIPLSQATHLDPSLTNRLLPVAVNDRRQPWQQTKPQTLHNKIGTLVGVSHVSDRPHRPGCWVIFNAGNFLAAMSSLGFSGRKISHSSAGH